MSDYDVVVIGGGPGGYIAAIRAAQNGLKVACIEGRGALGGTCTNVGCIPSKALLHASEVFEEAGHSYGKIGVKVGSLELDLPAMMAYKDDTVKGLTRGIEFLFKKNKIDYVKGWGSFKDKNTIEVKGEDGSTSTVTGKSIIIATGSEPASIPGVTIDEKRIVSSTGALALPEVPKHLVVIGGGVIGLELGSVWARLGAKVTVVEFLDRIVPGVDDEVAKEFDKILRKQGFTMKTGTKVTKVESAKAGLKISVEPAKGGDAEVLEADYVLVSVGRKAYTEGLGLDKVGVKATDRGLVVTDDHWRTNVDGIYAIGDVIAGPMLAHKSEEEGAAVADVIAGKVGHVNYDAIPNVIYTSPEVASVGKTEEELKKAGVEYKAGKFPFMANAKAKVGLHTEGFVKILADAKTDRVLGVHIIGADAGNLIAEAVLAMEFDASAEDIAMTCHAHPTLSESMKEAALAVSGRTLNF
ncbi:dihydrolipoyl dehydrogenase [Emcibacter sp. SYSU 3D8]|uniref:dihydrolipoyl dehydrogenase n=1 Tax=Emcibacter sp. SYSU 3D8 TaxID=3133969 RepID=UPI0031FEDB7A